MNYLNKEKIGLISCPYSPDLSSSDYFFLPFIEIEMCGHKFSSLDKPSDTSMLLVSSTQISAFKVGLFE